MAPRLRGGRLVPMYMRACTHLTKTSGERGGMLDVALRYHYDSFAMFSIQYRGSR